MNQTKKVSLIKLSNFIRPFKFLGTQDYQINYSFEQVICISYYPGRI